MNFQNAVNGVSYYITLKHRNSLETWSSVSVMFISNDLDYDFTLTDTNAFGNNMTLRGSRWVVYSGDANQDGTVDLADLSLIDNDAANFQTGYITTDINGDGLADISDLGITDNNSFNFVSAVRP